MAKGFVVSLLSREWIRPRPSWTSSGAGLITGTDVTCSRMYRYHHQIWVLCIATLANGLVMQVQQPQAGLGSRATVSRRLRSMLTPSRGFSLQGGRLLDADGGYTTRRVNSTPPRPRCPGKLVPTGGGQEGGRGRNRASAALVEKQRSLAKAIKSKGQELDWRGALSALNSAGVPPSVQCYNATIAAMAASGRWREALALLSDMRRLGFAPDNYTYSAAMKACGAADQAEEALALLDVMRKGSKEGAVRPDAFCFNVCISACMKGGLHDRGKVLLGEMRSEGVMPDVVSFNSVINGLGMAGRWEEALNVMEDMTMEGITPNSITYASAINACGQSKQLARALDLLREARLAGIHVGTSAYNAAIAACGHAGSARDALPLLAEMKERKVPRTVITYSSLINVCGKGGLPDAALELMRQMTEDEEGISPNAITYNALIHAVAGGGTSPGYALVSSPDEASDGAGLLPGRRPRVKRRWDRVMPLVEEMRAAGHTPDQLSYNLALLACAKKGEAAKTLQLLGDMRRAGLLPTSVSYGAAMSSLQRAGNGDTDQALSVLKRMKRVGVQPTLEAFNTAFSSCAKNARRSEAVRLMNEMKEEGVAPDERTFIFAIQACGRAGDASGALVMLRGMQRAGIAPGEDAFASTMEAFAERGDVDQILALLKEARDSAGSDDYDPCWPCTVIASRTCAAAGRTGDAVRLLQELPVDGDERERVANPRTDSDDSPSLSSVGSPASLPAAMAMATEGNSEDPAKGGAGGRKEEAWLEAFWAAAGTGDAGATLTMVGAAREAGVALTIEHYNRALRALEGGSRSRWR